MWAFLSLDQVAPECVNNQEIWRKFSAKFFLRSSLRLGTDEALVRQTLEPFDLLNGTLIEGERQRQSLVQNATSSRSMQKNPSCLVAEELQSSRGSRHAGDPSRT